MKRVVFAVLVLVVAGCASKSDFDILVSDSQKLAQGQVHIAQAHNNLANCLRDPACVKKEQKEFAAEKKAEPVEKK